MENITRGLTKCFVINCNGVGFKKLIVDTENIELTCKSCGEVFSRLTAIDKLVIMCNECKRVQLVVSLENVAKSSMEYDVKVIVNV